MLNHVLVTEYIMNVHHDVLSGCVNILLFVTIFLFFISDHGCI